MNLRGLILPVLLTLASLGTAYPQCSSGTTNLNLGPPVTPNPANCRRFNLATLRQPLGAQPTNAQGTPQGLRWNLVAVTRGSQNANWDIYVGAAGSNSANGNRIEFLVANGRLGPIPLGAGPGGSDGYIQRANGNPGSASLKHCDTQTIALGAGIGGSHGWTTTSIGRIFEFYIPCTGLYSLQTGGSATYLNWMLFHPGTTSAWRDRTAHFSPIQGIGNTPWNLTLSPGWHAIVVYDGNYPSNPAASDNYAIDVVPLGAPGTWSNYGLGFSVGAGIPQLSLLSTPSVNTTVHLQVSNPSPFPASGWLLVGPTPAAGLTPGTKATFSAYFNQMVGHPVCITGLSGPPLVETTGLIPMDLNGNEVRSIPVFIPCDTFGATMYAQAMIVDSTRTVAPYAATSEGLMATIGL